MVYGTNKTTKVPHDANKLPYKVHHRDYQMEAAAWGSSVPRCLVLRKGGEEG